jgi:alpha-L-arabinofuranosidase
MFRMFSYAWPDNFWNGASYEIIQGPRAGSGGTILTYANKRLPHITIGTFAVTPGDPLPAVGGHVLLFKLAVEPVQWQPNDERRGWSIALQGIGATVTTETRDLSRQTKGLQAVRLQAPTANDRIELKSFLDSSLAGPFMRFSGAYRIAFKAKHIGGSGSLSINVILRDRTHVLSQQIVGDWQTYVLQFRANEPLPPRRQTVEVKFSITGACEILLDDMVFEQISESDDVSRNRTAFTDDFVDAVRELNPGIIRYWGSQLGDTIDNQLAIPFARRRASFSLYEPDNRRTDSIEIGLHEFLELCLTAGSEPWYVMPGTITSAEAANLIQYLSGSSQSAYGAIRAMRGQERPWTDVFTTIHLEYGNEAWNGFFKGGGIEYPDAYGQRAKLLFDTMRTVQEFVPSRTRLLIGGQAVSSGSNLTRHITAASSHDGLCVAPYLQIDAVDKYRSIEAYYGPLFAEPEVVSAPAKALHSCPRDYYCNYMRQNYDLLGASSRPVPLSVYEVNLHTTTGSIVSEQGALDGLVPTKGAALAVAHHILHMLKILGITDQCVFGIHQYEYLVGSSSVKLWGIVRDFGVFRRRRPLFIALAMINKALHGDMFDSAHPVTNPTWQHDGSNKVAPYKAHYVHSYYVVSAASRSLILFNLHRASMVSVNITGVGAPNGVVRVSLMQGSRITAMNENTNDVIVTENTTTLRPNAIPIVLPPHSLNIVEWAM